MRTKHSNILILLVLLLTGLLLEGSFVSEPGRIVTLDPVNKETLTEPPSLLTRYPHVQSVTEHSLSLHWTTAKEMRSHVIYGTTSELGREVQSEFEERTHSVKLEGLPSGQIVYYQVLDPEGVPLTEVERTRTAPAPRSGEQIQIAAFGDSGEPDRWLWEVRPGEAQTEICRQIERVSPDLLIHTGDLIYNHGEWENYDPLFFEPYRSLLSRIPIYPCLGNHDIMTDQGAPYFANFHLPVVSAKFPERYYSADFGNIHLTFLDSTYLETLLNPEKADSVLSLSDAEAIQEEQADWLRKDLESAATKEWKIVAFHHPIHSTARVQESIQPRLDIALRDWVPLFEEYGVDLVLSGHEHVYERFHPLIGDQRDDERGVVYVVTGGGGGNMRKFQGAPTEASACRVPLTHHFVHLQVKGPQLKLEAIDREGHVIDSWVKTKTQEELEPAVAEK